MNRLLLTSLALLLACSSTSTKTPDVRLDAPATVETRADMVGDIAPDVAPPPQPIELRFIDASRTHLHGAAVPGRHLVVVDVDKDGDLDWLQAVSGGPNKLFVNQGNGHFKEASAGAMPEDSSATNALAVADFNGDGKPDVLVGNGSDDADQLLFWDGVGAFVPSGTASFAPCNTQAIVAIDLEGDGDRDAVLACAGATSQQRIYRNDNGLLVDVSELHMSQGLMGASDVLALDVDGDDDLDLFFVGNQEASRLFLNDGSGVFGLAAPTSLPTSAHEDAATALAADFNGDGATDLLMLGTNDQLWTGDGMGGFWDATELTLAPGTGGHRAGAVADLDLDAIPDVVLVRMDGGLDLLRNDGSGRFFDYSGKLPASRPLWQSHAVTVALVDGDQAPDLLVSTNGTPPRLLLTAWPETETDYDWRTPWPVPSVAKQSCDAIEGTTETMAEKAAYYDWIVPRLHQSFGTLEDGRVIDFSHVQRVAVDGPYPTTIVPDEELPVVVGYQSYGNAGLWTAKYVISQAFRYAVTGSEEALANVRTSFTANYVNLKITGTPGYFARGFWPPLPGHVHPNPDDEGKYGGYHLVEEGPYAGFTWKTDTSKDEYAGHLFAIGIVAKLVDDPELQAMAREMAGDVGYHLWHNGYWVHNENGEPTTYGSTMALSLDHIPAFNALHALSWTSVAARVSDDPVLLGVYHDCLLQRAGHWPCIDYPTEIPTPYTEHLTETSPGLLLGCNTNYDNVGMMMMAMANTIWFEGEPELRQFYQERLVAFTRGPDGDGYDLWTQQNPWFNFLFATLQPEATELQGRPAAELVKEAICTLKRFPATKQQIGSSTLDYFAHCESDRHGPLTDQVTDIELRCPRQFVWWTSPYKREECPSNATIVAPPQDFLVAYWFGRYLGFVDESM